MGVLRDHVILFERLPEGSLEGKIRRGAIACSMLTPMFFAHCRVVDERWFTAGQEGRVDDIKRRLKRG